jgi:large subunit ribosomal protein L32e
MNMKKKTKKPEFFRQSYHSYPKLEKKWKKPRGSSNKLRRHIKSKGSMPHVSYGTPKAIRYLHPSGFREILVYNVNDLEKIDAKKEAVKIGSRVGGRKRKDILKNAEERKIKVLNPGKA